MPATRKGKDNFPSRRYDILKDNGKITLEEVSEKILKENDCFSEEKMNYLEHNGKRNCYKRFNAIITRKPIVKMLIKAQPENHAKASWKSAFLNKSLQFFAKYDKQTENREDFIEACFMTDCAIFFRKECRIGNIK